MRQLTIDTSLPGTTYFVLPLEDGPENPQNVYREVSLQSVPPDLVQRRYQLPDAEEIANAQARFLVTQKVSEYLLNIVEECLTAKQLQIFLLYYVHNINQEEIALTLGLSGGQAVVSQMLALAKRRLRKALGPSFESLLRL